MSINTKLMVAQLIMSRQFRGAEIFAIHLSQSLTELGVEVKCLALFPPPGHSLDVEGVACTDLSGRKGKFFDFALLAQVKKWIKEFQPDIVQANAGDTLKYAVLAKVIFRLKYKIIFRNASTASLYIKSPLQKIFYYLLYRLVDRVISVSELSRNDFVKIFPLVREKIEAIPNGLSISKPFSRLNDFNVDEFNIVHVAGFSFEKNHQGLLRIFSSIRKKNSRAKLWLVGDGPLLGEIKASVEPLLLPDVIFTGSVSNPLDYISSANVLVLPSIIEGLPGVILESMYCRTPIVAYDIGGISEVVKSEETGWLVKLNDEKAFELAIQNILNTDSKEIERITRNAYSLVVNQFDMHKIAMRFLEAYRNI